MRFTGHLLQIFRKTETTQCSLIGELIFNTKEECEELEKLLGDC